MTLAKKRTVTWSPTDKGSAVTLSNNNLTASGSTGYTNGNVRANKGVSGGKWYWEVTCVSGSYHIIGIGNSSASLTGVGFGTNNVRLYSYDGYKMYASSANYGSSYTIGDIIGIALDMDNGTITFYKNGVSQGIAFTDLLSMGVIFPYITYSLGGSSYLYSVTANFMGPFAYPIPDGYSAYDPGITPKNDINSMEIGDVIPCRYTATSGKAGVFSELGTCTATEIPVTGTATPDGLFYFIMVGYDLQGRKKLIADRNIQTNISWDTLNTAGICSEIFLNYNTMINPNDKSSSLTLSNNNLTINSSLASWNNARCTVPKITGKWYFEMRADACGSNELAVGVANISAPLTGYATNCSFVYMCYGKKWNGSTAETYGISYSNGDIIGVLIDFTVNNGQITFYKNGISQGVAYTNIASIGLLYPFIMMYNTRQATVNFGYTPFIYPIPNGALSYNTNDFSKINASIRLLTGGISSTDKDDEWDNIIVNSDLNGKITKGDNAIWNWNNLYSWCKETDYSSNTSRINRGSTNVQIFNSSISSVNSSSVGYRPVLLCLIDYLKQCLFKVNNNIYTYDGNNIIFSPSQNIDDDNFYENGFSINDIPNNILQNFINENSNVKLLVWNNKIYLKARLLYNCNSFRPIDKLIVKSKLIKVRGIDIE